MQESSVHGLGLERTNYALPSWGRGLGSVYVSFNSPRRGVFVNIYGTEACLKADLVSQACTYLGPSKMGRIEKVVDCLRQVGQNLSSVVKLASKPLIGKLMTGQEVCIRSFAEAATGKGELAVSVEDSFGERACSRGDN